MNLYFLSLLGQPQRRESVKGYSLPNCRLERVYNSWLNEQRGTWYKNGNPKMSWTFQTQKDSSNNLSLGNLNLYFYKVGDCYYYSLRIPKHVIRFNSLKMNLDPYSYLIFVLLENLEKMGKKGNLLIRTTIILFCDKIQS